MRALETSRDATHGFRWKTRISVVRPRKFLIKGRAALLRSPNITDARQPVPTDPTTPPAETVSCTLTPRSWKTNLVLMEIESIITCMLPRRLRTRLTHLLRHSPAVVLLGPRQAGKTTLALAIGETHKISFDFNVAV